MKQVSATQAQDFYSIMSRHYDDDYASLLSGDDVRFYLDLAVEDGGPVLELGCGTGRVLLPTARAGVAITGLDSSPRMLERLGETLRAEDEAVRGRVELAQADMSSGGLDLGRRFSLVTAPFRGAQHLLRRDDQRRWLRNVRRHLADDGNLVFDVFQPDYKLMAAAGDFAVDAQYTDRTGLPLRRSVRVTHRFAEQIMDAEFRWEVFRHSGWQVESQGVCTMRWYTRGELENLLELEGFEVLEYWGSFRRDPFGEGATDQVVLARPVL